MQRTTPTIRAVHLVRSAWPPLLLLAVLGVVVAWRLLDGHAAPATRSGGQDHATAAQVERTGGDVRVATPSDWGRLGRSGSTVTWGSSDRSHTVTVASVEASVLPIPGVVAAVVRQTGRDLPGFELQGRPVPLELDAPAPRGDSAMLVRFTVPADDGGTVHVAQVWRRDSRAQRDVIATWTSSDGSWPASPRTSIPSAATTR